LNTFYKLGWRLKMMTKEQQNIVTHGKGSAFVVAGPGTGKTHVLCTRVQHLVERKADPERILLLTFSNAAALDMKTRLVKQFDISGVQCSTTHAFGLSIVMEHWSVLGFTVQPSVNIKLRNERLATWITKVATKRKVTESELRQLVRAKINGVRDRMIDSRRLQEAADEVIKSYQRGKQTNNVIDYQDMLNLSIQLFKKQPDVLVEIRRSIQHLLVDEVQDMTERECQFLYFLGRKAKSSVFVGDKKQCIFKFRGANPMALNKLEKRLKPVVYHLTESFRVPMQMLPLVNAIGADINNDPELTSNRKGFVPRFFCSADNDQQSDFVVREIRRLLEKGVSADEIGILGHTRRSLTLLAHALKMNGIERVLKYSTSNGGPVKVLKALMRITKWMALIEKDEVPAPVPAKALTILLENIGLPDVVQQELYSAICNKGWHSLKAPRKEFGDTHYRKILVLRKAVEKAATLNLNPESGTQILIDALRPFMGDKYGKREKLDIACDLSAVKIAMRGVRTWCDVHSNMLPTTTRSDLGVELVTCHGAKGKEWKYVFVINVVEGEFPFYFNNQTKLKEERHLFYVAASRASKQLFIVQSPVNKNSYARGSKKWPSDLKKESTFIRDYGLMLRDVT
jgi:DNA helicase-2/ATP-dependent DNA helicase PcrA